MFYLLKPMIEVINYLKANDFDVWMVSATEREIVRALVEQKRTRKNKDRVYNPCPCFT